MQNEKLNKLYKLAKIILLSLLIINCVKSCSLAYTWDDFITYCNKLATNEITSNNEVKTGAQYILNNKTALENQNMTRFDSFCCGRTDSYYYLVCANNMNVTAVNTSATTTNGYTTPNFCCRVNSNSISSTENNKSNIQQLSFNAFQPKRQYCWGLVTGNVTTQNYGYFNLYVPYTGPEFTPFNDTTTTIDGISDIHIENFDRSVKQWLLGTLSNYNENTRGYIEAYQGEGQQWRAVTHLFWNGAGEVFVNNIDLYYYQLYRIYFVDIINEVYSPTYGFYFMQIGETYNGQGLIYNPNGNEYQPIIKQLEEEQDFWEKAYETMFIPSGDYIQTKLGELKEELKLSGDYSGEILILENIKNNSGDFIISWNTMSTHFSTKGIQNENQLIIPSGEINFSKIERENESFKTTMKWVRILLGFSLIVILIKQGWKLLLKTLGLSTEVYEQHKEEQERLAKTQENEKRKQNETTRRQIFNANQDRLREYERLARKKGWKK